MCFSSVIELSFCGSFLVQIIYYGLVENKDKCNKKK